jgi:uncharacterized phage protein gp47/JayE
MSYTVRTRAQIRDSLLADWSARYHAAAETLLTIEGSPPYRWADALAVEIETLEAQAISLTLEIIPTTASDAGVLRHAAVDGVTQEPATAAVLSVTVRGVASSLITFGSAVLIAPGSGLRYAPSDETALTDGSGDAVVDFTCTTAGSEGNQSAGVELTWSSTPVFAEPTAVVVGTTVAGDDEESMESLAGASSNAGKRPPRVATARTGARGARPRRRAKRRTSTACFTRCTAPTFPAA